MGTIDCSELIQSWTFMIDCALNAVQSFKKILNVAHIAHIHSLITIWEYLGNMWSSSDCIWVSKPITVEPIWGEFCHAFYNLSGDKAIVIGHVLHHQNPFF
jgi:hypothetical protein